MAKKSERHMFIKRALDIHGPDVYNMLYSHVRDGESGYLPRVADYVVQALAMEMRYRSREGVVQYKAYLEDVSQEFGRRGYGGDRVRMVGALSGGHELHVKLTYRTWVINVEYGDIYALRWGSMKHGFWNLISWGYSSGVKVVMSPADTVDLLLELDSYLPDIDELISDKHRLVQKRMLKQRMDESLIEAALYEAGVKKYRLFSVSSVNLCLQVNLGLGRTAQIMIPSKESNVIIPKLQSGLRALLEEGKNELNAYIYYD